MISHKMRKNSKHLFTIHTRLLLKFETFDICHLAIKWMFYHGKVWFLHIYRIRAERGVVLHLESASFCQFSVHVFLPHHIHKISLPDFLKTRYFRCAPKRIFHLDTFEKTEKPDFTTSLSDFSSIYPESLGAFFGFNSEW